MSGVKQGTSSSFHKDMSAASNSGSRSVSASATRKTHFTDHPEIIPQPEINSNSSKSTTQDTELRKLSEEEEHQFEVPDETKTYSHIKQYPIANSWIRIAGHVPAPHVVRPRMYQMAYSPTLRNYTTSIDDSIDNYLLQLDQSVPQVRTLRMRDIRDTLTNPFTNLFTRIGQTASGFNELFGMQVTQPARRTVQDFRNAYSPLHDSQGRPIIRSQLDPFLKPFNFAVQSMIDERYKGIGQPPTGDYTNELTNSRRIATNGFSRGSQALNLRIQGLRHVPTDTINHYDTIYESNKQKRGEGRFVVMIASMDTARELLHDSYSAVNQRMGAGAGASDGASGNKVNARGSTASVSTPSPRKSVNVSTVASNATRQSSSSKASADLESNFDVSKEVDESMKEFSGKVKSYKPNKTM